MIAVDDILLKQPETDYIFTTAGGFRLATLQVKTSTSQQQYYPKLVAI
jgi:hypothetical protein